MRRYKVNIKFGKNVQRARKKLKISQEELAEKLNISRNHVGRIEKGRVNITLVLIEKMARTLKIKPSEIQPF